MSGREVKSLEDGWQKSQQEHIANKDAPPKITKLDHGLEVRDAVKICSSYNPLGTM